MRAKPAKKSIKKPGTTRAAPGKRDRTRIALIEAAIDILSEKGMEGTSIDELMQVAGMARGTFYNHFESREVLVSSASQFIRERIYQSVIDRIPESCNPEQTFTCITYGFIHYGLKYPTIGWALVRIGGSAHWVSGERFSRALNTLQKVMPDQERPYLGLVYIEGVALMVLRRLLERVITIEEADAIIGLALRGVGIDKKKVHGLLDTAKQFVTELRLLA